MATKEFLLLGVLCCIAALALSDLPTFGLVASFLSLAFLTLGALGLYEYAYVVDCDRQLSYVRKVDLYVFAGRVAGVTP